MGLSARSTNPAMRTMSPQGSQNANISSTPCTPSEVKEELRRSITTTWITSTARTTSTPTPAHSAISAIFFMSVLSCLVWLFLFEIFIYIFFYKKVKCFVNYTALANYYVKKYINNYSTPLSSSFSNGGSGSISNS